MHGTWCVSCGPFVVFPDIEQHGVGRYLVWSDIPNNVQMRWIEDDGRVTVTIRLPGGASFSSVSSRGRKCAWTRSRAVCSFGTLAAGKSAKLSFVARVTRRASVKATAAGRGTETSLANNVARAKTR